MFEPPPEAPLRPFDVARYIRSPEDAAAYLTEVLADGDEAEFRRALGAVARSEGMAGLAERTGLGRESLYKGLSETGNPAMSTILRVLRALDLKITITVASESSAAA